MRESCSGRENESMLVWEKECMPLSRVCAVCLCLCCCAAAAVLLLMSKVWAACLVGVLITCMRAAHVRVCCGWLCLEKGGWAVGGCCCCCCCCCSCVLCRRIQSVLLMRAVPQDSEPAHRRHQDGPCRACDSDGDMCTWLAARARCVCTCACCSVSPFPLLRTLVRGRSSHDPAGWGSVCSPASLSRSSHDDGAEGCSPCLLQLASHGVPTKPRCPSAPKSRMRVANRRVCYE